ncbi:hypothetical protein NEMIN01_2110 [Nematocida minor]|uniref:uncharacterized protein n=1 Tax=Nematocida minor TaxID=1912983 RepID=UPI00221F7AF8|nr:uncharacterized protein NEMIN01_2110 [Nematocida minor]KAI5192611.1 hypothetical protein NEMIN01_2110 [Nematocida minor]
MTIREVKLKINVDEILRACRFDNSTDSINPFIANSDRLGFLITLKNVFSKNIEIEDVQPDGKEDDQYSRAEKKHILDAVKNNIYRYFIYENYKAEIMNNLYIAIKARNNESIRNKCIRMLNELIKPNPSIYNPKHGICRKIDANEPLETIPLDNETSSVGSRTCALEIDDTKFSSLESLLQSTSESLDREFFFYIYNSNESANMIALKSYSTIKEYYTLDELYTKTCKGSDVLLIDYGLNLVRERYLEIDGLIKTIKEIEGISKDSQKISEKINEVFSSEELKVVISINDNLTRIAREKDLENCILKAIEYMANGTSLLKGIIGKKTLAIDADLRNFSGDYITGRSGLKRILSEKKRAELNRKIVVKEEEKEEIEKSGQSGSAIANEIHSLKYRLQNSNMQLDNIYVLLDSLNYFSGTSLAQKNYLFKKIEVLCKEHGVEIVEPWRLFSIRFTQKNVVKMLVLAVIFVAASGLFAIFAKERMRLSNVKQLFSYE